MQVVGSRNEDARRYIEWLEKGVFDALHRCYLNVVLLEIYTVADSGCVPHDATGHDDENHGQFKKDKLIEMYAFTVTYGESGAQLMMANKVNGNREEILQRQSIKKNTTDVLRSLLHLTKTLMPLPKKRIISARVSSQRTLLLIIRYHDTGLTFYYINTLYLTISNGKQLLYTTNTPEEYEPPMFQKADDNVGLDWFLSDTPLHEDVGTVITSHHQISLRIFVQDSTDNRKRGVLKPSPTDLIGELSQEGEESVLDSGDSSFKDIDVGGSSAGNTGRVVERNGTCVLRDTQQLDSPGVTTEKRMDTDLQLESTQHDTQKARVQVSLKRKILSDNAHEPPHTARCEKRQKKNSFVRHPVDQIMKPGIN